MAARRDNEEGAKALLAGLGSVEAIDAYIAVNPAVVAANDGGRHQRLQRAAAEVGRARRRGDLHRPVPRPRHRPDFAANVVGAALADFISDPSQIDTILSTVEEQKQTYTFE